MIRIGLEARQSNIVGHDLSLSVFLRLWRPLKLLQEQGHVHLTSLPAPALIDGELSNCDVLLVNRPSAVQSFALVREAKRLNIPVILDIDDWMYTAPSYSAGKLQLADRKLLNALYDDIAVMTVPTSFFSQVMTPLFDGPTLIVPYGIDFPAPASEAAVAARDNRILIASMFALKIGSAAENFAHSLRRFLDENPSWSVDFFCENFDVDNFIHPRINISPPISYEGYLNLLSSNKYKMCLAPLSSHEEEEDIVFNACKSPVKFVDYSANSIPTIFSRSPVYQSVVNHGLTGLLTDNTRLDWYSAISELASNAPLQVSIADAAYRSASSRFTTEHSAAGWKTAIARALGVAPW